MFINHPHPRIKMLSRFKISTLLGSLGFVSSVVAAANNASTYDSYAFVYFTGDGGIGEEIYISASDGNDGLSWIELNDGLPILNSTKGTTGVRDPFVMRSVEGDKFYLLATDLKVADSGWGGRTANGSRHLEIWESPDLINWSDQRHVLVAPETAGNAWAPEATYLESLGKYVVYWASALYDKDDVNRPVYSYQRVLYATTSDFITFSEPVIWQDSGRDRLDSTVIKVNDTFYRFTKDDDSRGTGCTDIIEESSQDLLAPYLEWDIVETCISNKTHLGDIEGPLIFKENPGDDHGEKFHLFVDQGGYTPIETEDIAAPDWKISTGYKLPDSSRHGTVIPVTSEEHAALLSAYGG